METECTEGFYCAPITESLGSQLQMKPGGQTLGMCRLLVGTSRIGLSVGGLSRTGVGGTWGDSSGLW